jgi:hypothetical protein
VRDLTSSIGNNAGKIWYCLKDGESLTKEAILECTDLDDSHFYGAIGWLAREDKIYEEMEDYFKLDKTNLSPKIGSNAGKVWKVLDIWGDVDFNTIKRLAKIQETEVYSALGWLARENKIKFDKNLGKFNLK